MSDQKADVLKIGGVHISGGSNVRAENIAGDSITAISRTNSINHVFQPVTDAIQQAPQPTRSDAVEQLEKLKHEVEKGEHADHHVITKLLDGIVTLVPDAVRSLAKAFASPILTGVSGPATQFLLSKLAGS